jgi:hypothetical protein
MTHRHTLLRQVSRCRYGTECLTLLGLEDAERRVFGVVFEHLASRVHATRGTCYSGCHPGGCVVDLSRLCIVSGEEIEKH